MIKARTVHHAGIMRAHTEREQEKDALLFRRPKVNGLLIFPRDLPPTQYIMLGGSFRNYLVRSFPQYLSAQQDSTNRSVSRGLPDCTGASGVRKRSATVKEGHPAEHTTCARGQILATHRRLLVFTVSEASPDACGWVHIFLL